MPPTRTGDKSLSLRVLNRAPVFLTLLSVTLAVSAWAAEGSDKIRASSRPEQKHTPPGTDAVRHWNEIAINASGLDHTRIVPEQLGPGRSSRAMAIVHIAVFDAVNAIVGGYHGYTDVVRAPKSTDMEAAVAQAAHDTLAALFPSQAASFDAWLAEDLAAIRDGHAKSNGVDLGQRVAATILALRSGDGSEVPDPHVGIDFFPSDEPGKWRMDPISQKTIALGAYWGDVTPFVMTASNQFRIPSPPGLTSPEYTAAFKTVKA